MNGITQSNVKPAGSRPFTAGEDLTDLEGRVLAFSAAKTLSLPTTATAIALMLLLGGGASGAPVTAQSLLDGGQARVRLNGTCAAGDILVVDVTSGNKGKAKALPATAGSYFALGVAVEAGVDEQLVLIEPLPRLVTVADAAVEAVTATATTGTLPTANGAVTIANAATPTVVELQEYCTELNAKIAALGEALTTAGITA
jgi:hypothetical protein